MVTAAPQRGEGVVESETPRHDVFPVLRGTLSVRGVRGLFVVFTIASVGLASLVQRRLLRRPCASAHTQRRPCAVRLRVDGRSDVGVRRGQRSTVG